MSQVLLILWNAIITIIHRSTGWGGWHLHGENSVSILISIPKSRQLCPIQRLFSKIEADFLRVIRVHNLGYYNTSPKGSPLNEQHILT